MSAGDYEYSWLARGWRTRRFLLLGKVMSLGRLWHTIAGPYNVGDVHIEPEDSENTLLGELVVNVCGDERSRTVIARSCESTVPVGDIGAMIPDISFVVPAIGRILGVQDSLI